VLPHHFGATSNLYVCREWKNEGWMDHSHGPHIQICVWSLDHKSSKPTQCPVCVYTVSYPPPTHTHTHTHTHKIQKIFITKIVYLECLNSASTSVKLKQMLFTFTCAFTSKVRYRHVPRWVAVSVNMNSISTLYSTLQYCSLPCCDDKFSLYILFSYRYAVHFFFWISFDYICIENISLKSLYQN
jgi:hypothetical protein